MLQITDLTRSYGEKEVLSIPSFGFVTGEVHGIVGLNGSGKTTFLNALYGFGRSKNARVIYENMPMDHTNTAFLEAENYFYPGITGHEYLALFQGKDTTTTIDGVNELLEVPLDELISTYSTGMRKKLALLGILKLDRPVLLLDEPMNGLDPVSYTHLTLPTSDLVKFSVVAVSLKKKHKEKKKNASSQASLNERD